MVPLLLKMRVLSEADGAALGNLCLDMSVLEQAQAKLQKSGLLVKTEKSGMIHQNPLLQVIAAVSERVSKGLRDFGMTPSSRSRIVVPPQTKQKTKWQLLKEQGEQLRRDTA
jgi:P27 family predicted phage terminase small subunit